MAKQAATAKRIVPIPTEHQEQVRLFKWLYLMSRRYPFLALAFAIPNGSYKSMAAAARFKAEGLKSGVPDILLPYPRTNRIFPVHGLFIEMKRIKGGVVSPAQKAWHEHLRNHGYRVAVCYGWHEAALAVIDYCELPVTVGP